MNIKNQAHTVGLPAMQSSAFKEALHKPAIAHEFFLPLERARWDGEYYTLGKVNYRDVVPTIVGIRLQEPDPTNRDPSLEKSCQTDLVRLISSIMELRKNPPLASMVLSGETVVGCQDGKPDSKRILFGLYCPADGHFKSDSSAAGECHRQILRAIGRARFTVEQASGYDPQTGFKGLVDWAKSVRLSRCRPRFSLWLALLLLLPLLLLLFPWMCSTSRNGSQPSAGSDNKNPSKLFGIALETHSFIILVDKSASMEKYFPQVRAEAKRLLNERLKAGKGNNYADVIVYDADARSALGQLTPLTDDAVGRLTGYLDSLQSGGGTNLDRAIELAAKEVEQHKHKTTLFILTDGEDNTVARMIQDRERIRRLFGETEVIANSTTPRLFHSSANREPVNGEEMRLDEFCRIFNGHFGPNQDKP